MEVFREQRARLWAFLARGAAGSAEDLLQETFLRAWDHRSRLAGPGRHEEREGARRYLWRVARNLVIDEIRMKQRSRQADRPVDPDRVLVAGHEGRVLLSDAGRALRETLATLPNPRARQCLSLWLEGGDIRSIAGRLRVGPEQVRGILQRGKAELIRRASARFQVPEPAPAAGKGGSS